MFKKIVVPIDFSENSLKLIEPAKFFAKKSGAEVHLVHVAEEEQTFNIHTGEDFIEFFKEIAMKREEWFSRLAEIFEKEGIDVKVEILKKDSASEAILEYIEEKGIDFGMISTTGIERIKTILIGSTTRQIIKHAKIPFFSINQHYRPPETFEIKKILVTTDFSDASYQGIEFASKLAEELGASLTILHVIKIPSYIPVLPGEPPLEVPYSVVSFVKDKFDEELSKITENLSKENVNYDIITGNDKSEAINQYAVENRCDLIVISRIGEGFLKALFLGRVAESMVQVSNVPVITFPPEKSKFKKKD